ncbi:unnamed protein product [Lupinus luteus]|uniref:Uncharacterized protein n=1 Tax=Lupinus luteus TaxID=3873 RepID=A0AAV1XKT5_LUPLU
MYSEKSPRRVSFSHDFSELQVLPLKRDVHCKNTMLHDSNSDFEFNTSRSNEFESSSADELFSNGVILPVRMIQERRSHYTKLPPRPCSSSVDKMKKETIKELLLEASSDHKKKSHSKSFWGFSRSKSLNCDTKQSLICSLPLLSRSNSTGKSYGGSYGNSFRISHVLNEPTPYVSKGGTNLFVLGSFLSSGKVKKNKK